MTHRTRREPPFLAKIIAAILAGWLALAAVAIVIGLTAWAVLIVWEQIL